MRVAKRKRLPCLPTRRDAGKNEGSLLRFIGSLELKIDGYSDYCDYADGLELLQFKHR